MSAAGSSTPATAAPTIWPPNSSPAGNAPTSTPSTALSATPTRSSTTSTPPSTPPPKPPPPPPGAHPSSPASAVPPAVLHTVRAFNLDVGDFEQFLASMAMDLTIDGYQTYQDLLGYMEGSAA